MVCVCVWYVCVRCGVCAMCDVCGVCVWCVMCVVCVDFRVQLPTGHMGTSIILKLKVTKC